MRAVLDITSTLLASAGVKNYFYYWAQSMQREVGPHKLSLFPYIHEMGLLNHQTSSEDRWATCWRLKLVGLSNLSTHLLDFAIGKTDLFHTSPHICRQPSGCKLTTTLYDMSCWLLPETHTPENVAATKRFADVIVKQADGVIALSNSTRNDALQILKLSANKIKVIYPGVSEAFFRVVPEEVSRIREIYALQRSYLLYVGTIEPRKNVDCVLNAYAALPKDIRQEHELVIVGPLGWCGIETRSRLEQGAGFRYLGYIPERHLPAVTAGAIALVYPSLYEGFGLPVVQAMATGVPVIVSNVSSLPEIVGEAGLLVDPRSASELSKAMQRLLLSPVTRQQLGDAARIRAHQFTWDRTAQQSWAFFDNVCN
jgi:glycosyltransferase involved in cell wall biosynthesis